MIRRLAAVLVLLIVCWGNSHAEVVSLGDAEFELYDDGTIGGWFVDGNSSPLHYSDHFVSINGGPLNSFFALESAGAVVSGGSGTVDLTYREATDDVMQVRVGVELTNPLAADPFAQIDFRVDFENVGSDPLSLTYYAYQDFDVDPAGFEQETASFDDGGFRQANVEDGIGREVRVFTPDGPQHWEINTAATTFDQFTTANRPFDLSDGTDGLITDIELAEQYERTLGVGETASIEYSLAIVPVTAIPEPGSFFALALAAVVWACPRGARKRAKRHCP